MSREAKTIVIDFIAAYSSIGPVAKRDVNSGKSSL
jgi:hypothetical protein